MGNVDTRGHIARVNSKVIGRIESIGDIKMNRAIKEYNAMNIEDVVVAIGTATTDAISISVLYDPADAAGAKEMETAFMGGTAIPFEIELSNIITAGTGNGTTFTWSSTVVQDMTIQQEEDGKVLANYSIKPNGLPTVTAAA